MIIFYTIKDAETGKNLYASTCMKDIKREMIRQARNVVTIWRGDDFVGKWKWINSKMTEI